LNKPIIIIDKTKMTNIVQKPFLKWVGGKTQILDHVLNKFPNKMNNYHEPFVGGGSVLFGLLSLQKQGTINIKQKVYAYDINEALINTYKHVQSNRTELYNCLKKYMDTYDKLTGDIINRKPSSLEEAMTSKESYYYWLRNKYNEADKKTVDCAALFMFINKTCFRGMYREGPNGYNVPYGHYKKTPKLITEQELSVISELIKDVVFIHCDFTDSFKNMKKGDFIYVDPPYVKENEKSFVKYVSGGFDLQTHMNLFDEIKKVDKKKVKFVLSNSKVDLVTTCFKEFNIEDIQARRAIHSKKPGSTTTEVIISN